jgi:hypothetical protein
LCCSRHEPLVRGKDRVVYVLQQLGMVGELLLGFLAPSTVGLARYIACHTGIVAVRSNTHTLLLKKAWQRSPSLDAGWFLRTSNPAQRR